VNARATQQHWGAEALWLALEPLLPGLTVEVLASAGSTNTVLLDRARGGADVQPCLLVAEHQTAGRGRLGRGWVATPGASLTFSLALPLAPADWGGLSLAVGLAVADALDTGATPAVWLKWPNDLWLADGPGDGRKLGGILIETVAAGAQRLAVVGVGLNVKPQAVPPGLPAMPYGTACLQELDPAASAPAVLARVAPPLLRALLRFQHAGFAPLVGAYARRDLLRGQAVHTTLPAAGAGVADGVEGDGALRVRAGGRLHRVASGEVSVRLQPVEGA